MDKISKKRKLRNEIDNYLVKKYNSENLKTKIENICGKAGAYFMPKKLYLKRMPRDSRAIIPWNYVISNGLTYEMLESFEGGIVVEFVNEDIFSSPEQNKDKELYEKLMSNLGSDNKVSSIISIRSTGESSSINEQYTFEKLIDNSKFIYRNKEVTINSENIKDYIIKKKKTKKKNNKRVSQGNDWWKGFIFYEISGGNNKNTKKSHTKDVTLFNPACEYASRDVMDDIDMVMCYFMINSIPQSEQDKEINDFKDKLEKILKETFYIENNIKLNLYDYCTAHYCMKYSNGKGLIDPIQLEQICINNFNISSLQINSVDLAHDESVNKYKLYWDDERKCVLTPTRPTNIFWSLHESNMMQQNKSLDEYFENEKEIYEKRVKLK